MSARLVEDARALEPELIAWRRDLHRHPELGFEETRTAAFLLERLEGLGLEITSGLATTGIAAVLRAPGDGPRPAVLLRADMDALPVQEVGGREYGSTVPGKMHACGHDGHMAMLLGAARMLRGRRDELPHDVVFCFQPGEEGMGGARVMIEEGVLDLADVRACYGLHLWSGYDVGGVWVRPGPTMAAQDEFTATIRGVGGHGALPHVTRDPIVAAAQAVLALQTIVSRNIDPLEPAVVTVGAIRGGGATNVIPDAVELLGTLRSFSEPVRETIRRRVPEILHGIAAAAGCTVDLDLRHGYPATINDPAAADIARRVALGIFGEDHVHEPPPLAAAEDFSYFLRERPGAFVFVGARNAARGIVAPHHAPEFDVDESALHRGAALLAALALHPELP